MEFFEKFRQHMDEFVIMLLASLLGMVIYLLSEVSTPMRSRLRLALLGVFISISLSLPIYYFMKASSLFVLSLISTTLAVCGQFIPELAQTLFKKFVKKEVQDRFGVSEDDSK